MSYLKDSYALTAASIIKNLEKRNMEGYYCENAEAAIQKVLELIPADSVVTWGGSETLVETGILNAVKASPYTLIDRTTAKTPAEKRELYGKIVMSDYCLMSTNAITLDGELINIDGAGNRVACLITGPAHVIVIAGMNKITANTQEGISRVHTAAAPPNTLRVGAETPCSKTGVCADCLSPGCICNQVVITRRSMIPGRIKVILIGDSYGF
ncbi:MAG: lactate utilization protein [Lachnospiraceae bacterium]